jgi:RimJ/RimL family protein N-acetyltransferase
MLSMPPVARSPRELRPGRDLPVRSRVTLRPVTPADLPTLFRHSQDPAARWMAAFGSRDPPARAAFRERWNRTLVEPNVMLRAVLVDGRVVGYVGRFPLLGQPAVAYWYDRAYWGRGIATRALRAFLRVDRTRPVFARVAYDNAGSIRVLEKCGFVVVGRARSRAAARDRRLTELILRLGPARARAGRSSRSTRPNPPRRPRRSGSRGA